MTQTFDGTERQENNGIIQMVRDEVEFTRWLHRYPTLLEDYATCGGEHYFWLQPDVVKGTELPPTTLRVKILRFADGRLELVASHHLRQSGGLPATEPFQRDQSQSDMLDFLLRDLQARLQHSSGIWQPNREY